MFTSPEEVLEVTGYEVDQETVVKAQSIVEVYIGRVEEQVVDALDMILLGKATAYQAAYMRDNAEMIFEQMASLQMMQFGQMVTFKDDVSPWVAPLARIACQRLSWKRLRSVKTGSIYYTPPGPADWRSE